MNNNGPQKTKGGKIGYYAFKVNWFENKEY